MSDLADKVFQLAAHDKASDRGYYLVRDARQRLEKEFQTLVQKLKAAGLQQGVQLQYVKSGPPHSVTYSVSTVPYNISSADIHFYLDKDIIEIVPRSARSNLHDLPLEERTFPYANFEGFSNTLAKLVYDELCFNRQGMRDGLAKVAAKVPADAKAAPAPEPKTA